MPMNFPDMKSLVNAAKVHNFREPYSLETEESYRSWLADHVSSIDALESEEIRNKVGWDQFSDSQNLNYLRAQIRKVARDRNSS